LLKNVSLVLSVSLLILILFCFFLNKKPIISKRNNLGGTMPEGQQEIPKDYITSKTEAYVRAEAEEKIRAVAPIDEFPKPMNLDKESQKAESSRKHWKKRADLAADEAVREYESIPGLLEAVGEDWSLKLPKAVEITNLNQDEPIKIQNLNAEITNSLLPFMDIKTRAMVARSLSEAARIKQNKEILDRGIDSEQAKMAKVIENAHSEESRRRAETDAAIKRAKMTVEDAIIGEGGVAGGTTNYGFVRAEKDYQGDSIDYHHGK
jgi:hypothetical protein